MSEHADTPLVNWSNLGVTELLPTGTVTLLLAEVEDSARLWQVQREAMVDAMARLDRALDDVVAAHGGVRSVEQGEGDSCVIAFARATDAVACALALQRAPLAPIRLRIGVHTGEARPGSRTSDIGPTVERTARLRDLAYGGQTLLSGTASDLVADRLPDGAWLTDLGIHALGDLPRPERVMQLCHPDLRNEFPPVQRSAGTGVHNRPVQLTSFVGRGGQIAEVRTLLADNRLVTLTGAGGAGKTRLAVEIAASVAPDYDGVWYVDLAPITHPAVVPVTVARALGLPDTPGSSTNDTLIRFVGDRQMVLLLDNCEHLLDATSALAVDLLGACPALRLLATSRGPTGVPGEVTFVVPSLSLTDEALELFTDRARRVRPDFRVTGHNVATVTEICRQVDGIPLAIELAAARVRALSLQEIVDGLHDRFRLLTGGSRTSVPRQQTLRASVDWSHALLTEPERVLLRRLAVFLGGFDLDAAHGVAGETGATRYQVLDQLALLVDKSLAVAENSGGTTRYRLLETVRQYGIEKLIESGEADDVRARHRDHYLALAELLDAPARTDFQQRIAQAETEIDNLRAAFIWTRETDDTAHALALASSLQPLWLTRERPQEGLAWLNSALTAPGADDADLRPVRARALADKATLLASVAMTDSIDDAAESLTLARQLQDRALLVRALLACGSITAQDAERSRPYLVEAAGLAREVGDSWRLGQVLNWQAQTALMAGDPVATSMAAEEGLALAESIGDRFVSANCRIVLATARTYRGDLAGSVDQLREVVAEATATQNVFMRVRGLLGQSFAMALRGDVSGARATADQAIADSSEHGQFFDAFCLGISAFAFLAAGDSAAARQVSETVRRQTNLTPIRRGTFIVWAAQAALGCGDVSEAGRWADEAASATKGVYLSWALATRARVELARDDVEQAERDVRDALGIAADVGGHLLIPDILECLADVARHAGSHREAARLFGSADASRRCMGVVRCRALDADCAASVMALRDAMGEEAFEAAWNAGAALSTQEAIAHAQRGRGERKRPASGWGSLTPAERDVVQRVAEGLSNSDIGARLFISPRTVQTHLTHVYAKLGLTSRMQLAQEAARHR